MNIFTKIIKVLFAPLEAMPKLNGPDWLLPVILTVIVAFTITMVIYPTVLAPIAEQQIDKQIEKAPAAQQGTLAMAKQKLHEPMVRIIQAITGAVFQVVGILLLTLIVMATGAILGGKAVKFTIIFPIISWASLVGVIENLIKFPLMLFKESPFVSFSPAAFLDIESLGGPLYGLLNQINPFALWWVAIVSAGLTVHLGFSRRKSVFAVLMLGAAWALVSMVLSAVGLSSGG